MTFWVAFWAVVVLVGAAIGGVFGYLSNRVNPWFIVYGAIIGAFLMLFAFEMAHN